MLREPGRAPLPFSARRPRLAGGHRQRVESFANSLVGIYRSLWDHFGHQEWWPADAGAFEVIVGAYLVQNVAWSNAYQAVNRLRAAGLLEPAPLAAAPREQVEACVRPAGYFRQKAERLQLFARHVAERYGGDLQAMLSRPWPALRQELLALKGVGPETADSVGCYAAGRPVMVVDAYTKRIFHRLGLVPTPDTPYDALQALFHQHLPPDVFLYNDYHAQLVALGNRYCLKRRPRCAECPLAHRCPRLGVTAGDDTGERSGLLQGQED